MEEAFSAEGHHGSLDDLLTCLFSTLQPGVKGGHAGGLAPLIGYMDYLPLPDDAVVCATFCLCELKLQFLKGILTHPDVPDVAAAAAVVVCETSWNEIYTFVEKELFKKCKGQSFLMINFVSAVVVIDILIHLIDAGIVDFDVLHVVVFRCPSATLSQNMNRLTLLTW